MDAVSFVSQFGPLGESPSRTIEKLYGLGHWLLEQERYADAALAFRTMLLSAPTDERSWLALGLCHEQVGQLRVALELYGAGTAAVPAAVRCRVARARLLRLLSRDAEADEALEQAREQAHGLADDELLAIIDAERQSQCQ